MLLAAPVSATGRRAATPGREIGGVGSVRNHKMVQKQGRFEIAPLPNNNLATIRQMEQLQALNTQ